MTGRAYFMGGKKCFYRVDRTVVPDKFTLAHESTSASASYIILLILGLFKSKLEGLIYQAEKKLMERF